VSEESEAQSIRLSSGKRNKIYFTRIRFDEYGETEDSGDDSKPLYELIDGIIEGTLGAQRGEFGSLWEGAGYDDVQAFSDQLLRYPEHGALRRLRRARLKAKDSGSRYVYVFKRRERGRSHLTTFSCVINVDSDGMYAWAETNGQARDVFSLTVDSETMTHAYFLLSPVELPVDRIEYYRTHSSALQRRALTVGMDDLKSDTDGVATLPLVDFVSMALRLQDEFLSVHEDFERERVDEKKTAGRLLLDVIRSLSQHGPFSDDMSEWLDMDRINSEGKALNDAWDSARVGSQISSRIKCGWHQSVGFQHARNDYTGTKRRLEDILEIEGRLLVGNLYTSAGHEYAQKIIGGGASWYRDFGLPSEEIETLRKTITSSETFWEIYSNWMVGAVSKALRLQKMPGGVASKTIAPAVQRVHSSILVRSKLIQPADLSDLRLIDKAYVKLVTINPNGSVRFVPQWKSSPGGIVVPNVGDEWQEYSELKKNPKFWKWLEKADKGAQKLHTIVVGVELINLCLSVIEVLQETDSDLDRAMAGVNVVGSSADLGTALASSSRNVKAWGVVGIVGAVCDYAVAVHMIVRSGEDEQPWQVQAGYALKALGSVAVVAAGVLKAELAASVLGFSSWNPVLLVGVVLILVGAAIVAWYHRAPFEKWAKSSPWSIGRPAVSIEQMSKGQVFDELEKLLSVVLRPHIQVLWAVRSSPSTGTEPGMVLRIYPGLFQQGLTRILVRDFKVVYQDNTVLPGIEFPVLGETQIVIPHDRQGEPLKITGGLAKVQALADSPRGLSAGDRTARNKCRSVTRPKLARGSKAIEYIEEFWPAGELSESRKEHIERLLRIRPIIDPRLPFWGTIPDKYLFEGRIQLGLYIDASRPVKVPENIWDKDAEFDGHVMVDLESVDR